LEYSRRFKPLKPSFFFSFSKVKMQIAVNPDGVSEFGGGHTHFANYNKNCSCKKLQGKTIKVFLMQKSFT
jgi:hypothetical protein